MNRLTIHKNSTKGTQEQKGSWGQLALGKQPHECAFNKGLWVGRSPSDGKLPRTGPLLEKTISLGKKAKARVLTSWGAVACCDLAVQGNFYMKSEARVEALVQGAVEGYGRARRHSSMSSKNVFALFSSWTVALLCRTAQNPTLYCDPYCFQSA